MPRFANPRGTQDILPADWSYWDFVVRQATDVARLFGYRRIETPIFGDMSLFARTSGEGTDVVDKEMYVFEDRDGRALALRPEGTASVMRAYFEHGMNRLPQPVKLFYIERMYRYDKPQQGRYREHRQFGCEAIGLEDAFIDAEMISLLVTFYRRLGLDNLSLHLNSIGDGRCRPAYLERLVDYLVRNRSDLAEQDRERTERNPLRVLDSKEPASQRVIEGAPRMVDTLCEDCRVHWERLLRGLQVLDIAYTVDSRLVRGLDYYTRTVFEFQPSEEGAQSVLGGGGRYDALAALMGERDVPGIGFGAGVERIVLAMKRRGVEIPETPPVDVYVAHVGEHVDDAALRQAFDLRREGVATDMSFGGRALKTQLKNADAAGARVVAIIGEDELSAGVVTVHSLATHEDTRVPKHEVGNTVKALL